MEVFNAQLEAHLKLTDQGGPDADGDARVDSTEFHTVPLFSSQIVQHLAQLPVADYGLIGRRIPLELSGQNDLDKSAGDISKLIYANIDEPWSAFICGSQGSGKSYTLASLLENCILSNGKAGPNFSPAAAMAFHYDQFTAPSTTQYCELAYLCTAGIKVRIVVAPSKYERMKLLYENLPKLQATDPQPEVIPFRLHQDHLSVENIMAIMNVKESDSSALYLAVLRKVLRELATADQSRQGIDYGQFKDTLSEQGFTEAQDRMLKLRLALLDEMLKDQIPLAKTDARKLWHFEAGSLTIIDLSSPLVNIEEACALFSISLNLFLAERSQGGRVLLLDEAHKFMTQTGEAQQLTEQLMAVIRQQRHLRTRVMIATQEPTIDTRLLDLCDVTFVHRFRSPAWFSVLQDHLAGSRRGNDKEQSLDQLFGTIIGLGTGRALLFSPNAVLRLNTDGNDMYGDSMTAARLKDGYIKVRIRKRLTRDGGESLKASDEKPKNDFPPPDPNIYHDDNADQADDSSSSSSSDGGGGAPMPPAKAKASQHQQRTAKTVSSSKVVRAPATAAITSSSTTTIDIGSTQEITPQIEQSIRRHVRELARSRDPGEAIEPHRISKHVKQDVSGLTNRIFKKEPGRSRVRIIIADETRKIRRA